jgi:phage-related protein
MTTIVAKIRDSLGAPVADGMIRVTLTYDLSPTGQNYTTVPADVLLNGSGEATFSLAPSEVDNVAYKFELFRREWDGSRYVSYPIKAPFYAKVPDLSTPLPLSDLVPTGIGQDALDTSFTSIIRRLYSSEDFWSRFQDSLIVPKGLYDPDAYYRRGDFVFYQGWTFVNVFPEISQAPAPVLWVSNEYWYPWAARGLDGSGAMGVNVDYDAIAWTNSQTAVSQETLRRMVGTTLATQASVTGFANAVDGTLTRPVLAGNPTAGDDSLSVPSTSWVKDITDELAKAICPIGSMVTFAGSSAPARWVLCDGRTVSRATYSDLFAVVGTAYNTGGEAGTAFRLPDLRTTPPYPVSPWIIYAGV